MRFPILDAHIWQVDSQLADLGVDSASVKRINHSAVLMHLDAFGGPARGPLSDAVGYDDLLQAATGIQARFRYASFS